MFFQTPNILAFNFETPAAQFSVLFIQVWKAWWLMAALSWCLLLPFFKTIPKNHTFSYSTWKPLEMEHADEALKLIYSWKKDWRVYIFDSTSRVELRCCQVWLLPGAASAAKEEEIRHFNTSHLFAAPHQTFSSTVEQGVSVRVESRF